MNTWRVGTFTFFVFSILGLGVNLGYNTIKQGSSYIYRFYYQSDNDTRKAGFGCICTEAKVWLGLNATGIGFRLDDNNIFPQETQKLHVGLPGDVFGSNYTAYCTSVPRVGNTPVKGNPDFPRNGCP